MIRGGTLMKTFTVLLKVIFSTVVLFAIQRSEAITVPTVPIGNPGNASDVQLGVRAGTFGSVAYDYRIGKTEVTNAQYTAFLNSVDPTGLNARVLWNSSMSSD